MIKFRFLFLTMLMAFGLSSQKAHALSPMEQSAQSELITKLSQNGYRPAVDNTNGNVVINKGENAYWISIKGLRQPMQYTVNIKGFVFNKATENLTVEQRREIASNTAWEVNNKSLCKVTYNKGEVSFFMPIYASSADLVVNSLENIFTILTEAHKSFTTLLPQNQKKYLEESANVMQMEGKDYIVVEPAFNLPTTTLICKITKMSIRVVDSYDHEVIPYDQSIRKDNALYIQPQITIESDAAGECPIGIRIYNPDGKLMVPFPDAKFTAINIVDVKKNKKGVTYQLDKFGYGTSGKWMAGEYRIEFVINNQIVYNDKFHIL